MAFTNHVLMVWIKIRLIGTLGRLQYAWQQIKRLLGHGRQLLVCFFDLWGEIVFNNFFSFIIIDSSIGNVLVIMINQDLNSSVFADRMSTKTNPSVQKTQTMLLNQDGVRSRATAPSLTAIFSSRGRTSKIFDLKLHNSIQRAVGTERQQYEKAAQKQNVGSCMEIPAKVGQPSPSSPLLVDQRRNPQTQKVCSVFQRLEVLPQNYKRISVQLLFYKKIDYSNQSIIWSSAPENQTMGPLQSDWFLEDYSIIEREPCRLQSQIQKNSIEINLSERLQINQRVADSAEESIKKAIEDSAYDWSDHTIETHEGENQVVGRLESKKGNQRLKEQSSKGFYLSSDKKTSQKLQKTNPFDTISPFQNHQSTSNQLTQDEQPIETHIERVNQSKCLGCSKYFVSTKPIYHRSVSDIPVKVMPSILKLKDHEVEFKDSICSMLNSGGGIILFNCRSQAESIYAEGEYLTQKSKQDIEQRINSYFRWIHPKPEINTNIKISFVPILINGVKKEAKSECFDGSDSCHSQDFTQKDFIEGVYVTRLRVAPADNHSVYFWFYNRKDPKHQSKQDITMIYCSTLDQENKPQTVNSGQMRRLMKKKVKQNYISETMSGLGHLLMEKPTNIFGHECDEPLTGYKVMKESVKVQAKSEPHRFDFQKIKTETQSSFQFKYPNMALLIARKQDLQKIKKKLNLNGVECEIDVRFHQHKFRLASNSAVLYHSKSFETVRALIVNDPQFRFSNGKPYIAVNVTNYVRLELRNEKNGVDSNTLREYVRQLEREFAGGRLSLYSYEVGQRKLEYYLSTDSKISLLFLYFSLNHHGEKASLKNPFNLEKHSLAQKLSQFKPIQLQRLGLRAAQ